MSVPFGIGVSPLRDYPETPLLAKSERIYEHRDFSPSLESWYTTLKTARSGSLLHFHSS
jgi:hypothetical protein